MDLTKKTKISLDETRMLILGAQILVGFQFNAVFQQDFAQLPPASRGLDGIALVLMLVSVALLIAYGFVVWLDSSSLTAGAAGTALPSRRGATQRSSTLRPIRWKASIRSASSKRIC